MHLIFRACLEKLCMSAEQQCPLYLTLPAELLKSTMLLLLQGVQDFLSPTELLVSIE